MKIDLVPAAEELAVLAYEVTAAFPRTEQYGLTSQIRRAAISVGSNIVEGCHRQGDRAFLPFLHHALGSAGEMEFQLRVAARLQFGQMERVQLLQRETVILKKRLVRFIVAIRSRGE